MKEALQAAFGKAPILQRGGGGIGAVGMFKRTLGVNSILTGFSLPDDNLHGPKEKLHLPTWKTGMAALVHFFHMVGIVLLATLALLPPLLEGLFNYPVVTIGLVTAPRGMGTFAAMIIVGRVIGKIDARVLVTFGMLTTALSL